MRKRMKKLLITKYHICPVCRSRFQPDWSFGRLRCGRLRCGIILKLGAPKPISTFLGWKTISAAIALTGSTSTQNLKSKEIYALSNF